MASTSTTGLERETLSPAVGNMPTTAEIFCNDSLSSVRLTTRPLLMELLERAGILKLAKGAHAEDLRDALERLKTEFKATRLDATDRATVGKLVLDHLTSQKITNARPLVRTVLGELTASAAGKPAQAATFTLIDDEPAAEPVDSAALLDETAALLRRHVVLSQPQADAIALWVAAAHAIESLDRMAMLLLSSPTPECGKTTAATMIGGVVPRPFMVASLTTAVLFRLIHEYRPTLIADEVDSWLTDEKSELRGVFNAAHWRSGAVIPRCVGDDHRIELFNVFGAKVIAMIGRPPTTMLSRCITITLRRKTADEHVAPLREDRLRGEQAPLRRRWQRWALDNLEALRAHEPVMPPDLPVNRASDNWRPLLSIADLAGGSWPARARAAALALTGVRVSDDEPVNVALLTDVRAVFSERGWPEYLSSEEIIVTLKALPERPWADWNHGRGLTTGQLASRLRDFGTGPLSLRTRKTRLDASKTAQRWHRVDFEDAWSRYVVADPERPEQSNEIRAEPAILNTEQRTLVPVAEIRVEPMFIGSVPGVPASATNLEEEIADGLF